MTTTVRVPPEVEVRLTRELERARKREIGGILMAEQLEPGCFRVVDITVQRHGGTIADFVRSLASALQALGTFFRRTEQDYKRFNYLGEWHSHPSFEPVPSVRDEASMLELVTDDEVGATFAVLLIVKLVSVDGIGGTASVYRSDGSVERASLTWEGRS